MLRFIPYILKNLRGHALRTTMTVIGTAMMMFLFTFVSSIQEGLHHLTTSRHGDDRLIVFQAYRFCPSVSQLPIAYESEIVKVPGVASALPIKVVVNNCRASLDTVVFHGVPPDQLQRSRSFTLQSGDWSAFVRRRDGGALVGRKIAERRNISVGKPFTISGITVNVEGIFQSTEPGEENIIYTHLPFLLQQTPGHHSDLTVTMYEVQVADARDPDTVAREIDARIRERFVTHTDTKPQKAYYRRALADLMEVIGYTRWLGFVCVGVVGILVANSVLMAAQDRVKEHAVLQTIGYSGGRIFGLMLTESLIQSVIGGGVGILACALWLWLEPMTLGSEGVSVDFLASPTLAVSGLGLAVVLGVVAGVIPAWQAGRAEITASLRA